MKCYLSSLKSHLGFLFQNKRKDKHYAKFQARFTTGFACAFNLALLLAQALHFLYLSITKEYKSLIISGIMLGISFIAFLLRAKLPLIYRAIFIAAPILNSALIMNKLTSIFTSNSPYNFFLLGNLVGAFEAFFLFQFRKHISRIFSILLLLIIKLCISTDFIWIRVCLVLSIFIVISFLDFARERFQRSSIEETIKLNNNLKKFKELLSTNFPLSVLIITCDLKKIMYRNNNFRASFNIDSNLTEEESIFGFFKKFNVDSLAEQANSPLSSPILVTPNLFEHIQGLSCHMNHSTNIGVMKLQTAFIPEEGVLFYYNIRVNGIKWDHKPCYVLVFNDVTDWQTAQMLKLADEQKDRVIATLSHELRTPINGILGLLEILKTKSKDLFQFKYLDHCTSCAKLLLYLVNSILDLRQLRRNYIKIVKETFSLDRVLEEIKSLYIYQSQQNNITFKIEKAPNIPNKIYTDKYRLIAILINLLNNAFKFTYEGSVTLSISIEETDPNCLRFCINDTGIGVRNEDKPRLFSMFGQLHMSSGNINSHGVGLGLTIANNLAKALHPSNKEIDIEFHSEYKKGSSVIFKILFQPLNILSSLLLDNIESIDELDNSIQLDEFYGEETHITNKVKTVSTLTKSFVGKSTRSLNSRLLTNFIPQSQTSTRLTVPRMSVRQKPRRRVLIVDDNHFNLLAASFILEKNGLDVIKAVSGIECLKILKKSKEENRIIDLILMDIQMPIQDGIETSRIILSKIEEGKFYKVPIIALTAKKSTEQDLIEYKESGILDVLEKPLQEDKFQRILNVYCPV